MGASKVTWRSTAPCALYQTRIPIQRKLGYSKREPRVISVKQKNDFTRPGQSEGGSCSTITVSDISQKHGPVAQRLEQGTHNPLVGGSNPSRTNLILCTAPARFVSSFRRL